MEGGIDAGIAAAHVDFVVKILKTADGRDPAAKSRRFNMKKQFFHGRIHVHGPGTM
jgi:hypothetical protein